MVRLSYFQKEERMANHLPMPDLTICSQLNLSFSKDDSAIPFTIGLLARPTNEVYNLYCDDLTFKDKNI